MSDRKEFLVTLLSQSKEPRTGTELAHYFQVTRQVIVKDIAVLRAKGHPIVATPQGYYYAKARVMESSRDVFYRVMTIRHRPEDTELELLTLVDAGITVVDVSVDHPIYGEFVANLMFSSRRDVQNFTDRLNHENVPLLLTLAGGVHRHTLVAKSEAILLDAFEQLRALGFELMEDS